MTNPQSQPARQIGLNRRSGSVFGLQPAPDVVVPAATPAPPAAIRRITPPAPAVTEQEEPAVVRVGLYMKPSVADAAQNAMAAFGSRNAQAIRQRGARRNSLNAFLTAVLEHALEHFDEVDPVEIVRRMPTAGPKR